MDDLEARKAKIIKERKAYDDYRKAACIQKKDLVDGGYYTDTCRNAELARWNAAKQVFVHWRTKFGKRFTETIKHPADEEYFDVFYPQAHILAPVNERDVIPLDEEA